MKIIHLCALGHLLFYTHTTVLFSIWFIRFAWVHMSLITWCDLGMCVIWTTSVQNYILPFDIWEHYTPLSSSDLGCMTHWKHCVSLRNLWGQRQTKKQLMCRQVVYCVLPFLLGNWWLSQWDKVGVTSAQPSVVGITVISSMQ